VTMDKKSAYSQLQYATCGSERSQITWHVLANESEGPFTNHARALYKLGGEHSS